MDAKEILSMILAFAAPFVVVYQVYLHKGMTANKDRNSELQNAVNLCRASIDGKCDSERVRELIEKETADMRSGMDHSIGRISELSKEMNDLHYQVGKNNGLSG